MAFSLFGLDKWKAVRKAWRVRERMLLLWAALGGSVGALLAMRLFRHKTRKARFAVGVPLILFAQIVTPLFLHFRLYESLSALIREHGGAAFASVADWLGAAFASVRERIGAAFGN